MDASVTCPVSRSLSPALAAREGYQAYGTSRDAQMSLTISFGIDDRPLTSPRGDP
jgi:hypothetical protein